MPQQSVDELIRQEEARLEQCDAKLASIIANPPVQHSAIGKVVIDPRTGEAALNHTPVIAAIRERRLIGESLRRLRGTDAPSHADVLPDLTRELELAKAHVFRIQDLERENAALRARLLEAEATPAMILSNSNGDTSPTTTATSP
jgi:hypothetical protein